MSVIIMARLYNFLYKNTRFYLTFVLSVVIFSAIMIVYEWKLTKKGTLKLVKRKKLTDEEMWNRYLKTLFGKRVPKFKNFLKLSDLKGITAK